MPAAKFDRKRFEGLSDGELVAMGREAYRTGQALRSSSHRTKEAAHRKVDALRAAVVQHVDAAIQDFRHAAAQPGELPLSRLGNLPELLDLADSSAFWKALHDVIDAPAGVGRAELFVADTREDIRTRVKDAEELERAVDVERRLRQADRQRDDADKAVAAALQEG